VREATGHFEKASLGYTKLRGSGGLSRSSPERGTPLTFALGVACFRSVRIPTIATTYSDPSRPPVTIDRDQRGRG
ncbi:MAG: hypothetical protein WB500_13030, partial [Rhodoplanes sp.]